MYHHPAWKHPYILLQNHGFLYPVCDTILWSYHYHAFPYKPHNFQNICEEDKLIPRLDQMQTEAPSFPGIHFLSTSEGHSLSESRDLPQ